METHLATISVHLQIARLRNSRSAVYFRIGIVKFEERLICGFRERNKMAKDEEDYPTLVQRSVPNPRLRYNF